MIVPEKRERGWLVKGQVRRLGGMELVPGLLRMMPIISAAVREAEEMGGSHDEADYRYR